jgi:hypothetical protein
MALVSGFFGHPEQIVPGQLPGEIGMGFADVSFRVAEELVLVGAEALHSAEAAAARNDAIATYGPARVAQHISARTFLAGDEGTWIDEERRRLADLYARSLELVAQASLEIGGRGTAPRHSSCTTGCASCCGTSSAQRRRKRRRSSTARC